MAQNKTQPTAKPVSDFIESIEDENKRSNCIELVELMSDITGQSATMWGDSIVGFGKYKTGRSCLYVKSLDDIDRKVLAQLVQKSVNHLREKYPG